MLSANLRTTIARTSQRWLHQPYCLRKQAVSSVEGVSFSSAFESIQPFSQAKNTADASSIVLSECRTISSSAEPNSLHKYHLSLITDMKEAVSDIMDGIFFSSTRKKRRAKMNKHKLRKRNKKRRFNTKASRR